MTSVNRRHEANRRHWDYAADYWPALRNEDGLWQQCITNPGLAFEGGAFGLIDRFVGDLAGKHVCVIGSGDNYAVFALASLGAHVTSVDISKRQLDVAAARATTLGLNIEFVRSDAVDVATHGLQKFDLVCSTNGFFVWISDPAAVCSAVHAILKPDGYYILYDVHPFLRPWADQLASIEMQKPYAVTGPFEDKDKRGETVYEFHWRVSDLLNALAHANLALKILLESPAGNSRFWQGHSYRPGTDDDLLDWRQNPRAGLPAWLTIAAQK